MASFLFIHWSDLLHSQYKWLVPWRVVILCVPSESNCTWSLEISGSVVECLTWDRGTAGSSLTGITVLCPWAKYIYPCLVLDWYQEDLSRHDWKFVDWDVKNQIMQKAPDLLPLTVISGIGNFSAKAILVLFVCLIWFFTSHQQSFS